MEDKTQGHQPKNIVESTKSWARQAWAHLESVRQASPLIQCITNFVSMDLVANVLLSAGASPAMISCVEEKKHTQGADSTHESTDAVAAAKSLAQTSGSIVAVSGAVDIVTDGQRVVGAQNGVAMLQKITATGCSVTALIAAFVAIDPSRPFEATATALSVFGLAGEIGMSKANGPASLRANLIDALHGLDRTTVLQHANVSNI
ncbi:hypothetical protein DH2020_005198 [Rehmannia glutinosa]|uniref:hydroxyethylthiazole kinase n=1 Tax=Rehmannia glutinosa TaxID=99300 RepID=A0ABR0XRI9_REHGL